MFDVWGQVRIIELGLEVDGYINKYIQVLLAKSQAKSLVMVLDV